MGNSGFSFNVEWCVTTIGVGQSKCAISNKEAELVNIETVCIKCLWCGVNQFIWLRQRLSRVVHLLVTFDLAMENSLLSGKPANTSTGFNVSSGKLVTPQKSLKSRLKTPSKRGTPSRHRLANRTISPPTPHGADRFIPDRTNVDFERSHYLVSWLLCLSPSHSLCLPDEPQFGGNGQSDCDE